VKRRKKMDMMTVPKAAKRSRLPENYLRKLCDEGRIVSIRSGTRRYLDWEDLQRFIREDREARLARRAALFPAP
jgi:excisionase family DNA binding protein